MSETARNNPNRNGSPAAQPTGSVTNITVLAAPRVLEFISQEALRYDNQGLETGGILVGCWLEDDTVYLVGATGSGPRAEHAQYSFAVDTDFANAELNRIRQSYPGSDYVGEWHKHPAILERPSQGDLMTARELLADPDYPVRLINPIITVKNRQAHFHFFYLDRNLPDFVKLQEHGQIEAETDNEPWDNGSTIYHANIVMLPKSGQLPPAEPASPPKDEQKTPPQLKTIPPRSPLEIPSPFSGEASDIDSQTIKKYASTIFEPIAPARYEPNKFFDPVPPARLSTTYTGTPNQFFDPVPPARLASNYQPSANSVDDSADDTVAFRPLSEPTVGAASPKGSNNTLLFVFIGLMVLFAILMILFFLTR